MSASWTWFLIWFAVVVIYVAWEGLVKPLVNVFKDDDKGDEP